MKLYSHYTENAPPNVMQSKDKAESDAIGPRGICEDIAIFWRIRAHSCLSILHSFSLSTQSMEHRRRREKDQSSIMHGTRNKTIQAKGAQGT